MAMVETRTGPPRRLCDTGNTLSVGATTDVSLFSLPREPVAGSRRERQLMTPLQTLLFDRAPFLQGLLEAGDLKRVLDVKQIVVAVNWLCVSQLADPSQHNFYQRPPRYWTNIDSLSLVRATAYVPRNRFRELIPDAAYLQRPPPFRRRQGRSPRSCVPSSLLPSPFSPLTLSHSLLPPPPRRPRFRSPSTRPPRPRRHALPIHRHRPLARRHDDDGLYAFLRALRQYR